MLDFTQIQRQRDLANSLMGQALTPQQNQTPLTGLARILTAHLANKRAQDLDKQELDVKKQRQSELARILSAGRGLEIPTDIQGNELAGPPKEIQGGRESLIQALGQSVDPELQMLGLQAELNPPKSTLTPDPSNVREWNFYNALTDDQKKEFLNMKRAGFGAGGVQYTAGGDQIVSTDKIAKDKADIAGAETTAKEQAKESVKDAAAAPKEEKRASDILGIINRTLASDSLDNAFGVIESNLPTIRQGTADVEADLNQIQGLLALAARGELKGQGQISDFEGKMLKNAQTVLSNPNISSEKAREELNRLKEYFSGVAGVQDQPQIKFLGWE